jgi:RNA polymerase sigma factor (sigma-70 family)
VDARDPLAALMARAGRGESQAARQLVERLGPRTLNLARRMLGDAAEAEDVTQETFLRVWRAAPGWKPDGAQVATWAHRVTVNLCLDRLRRSGRMIASAEPPEQTDEAPLPLEGMIRADRARAVREALARLPERQRAAIALVTYDGLSQSQAAEVLEVSVEALESLLARARRALKAMLADLAREAA